MSSKYMPLIITNTFLYFLIHGDIWIIGGKILYFKALEYTVMFHLLFLFFESNFGKKLSPMIKNLEYFFLSTEIIAKVDNF